MKKKYLLLFLYFYVIAILIYFPGIQAPRYGDDFNIVPRGDLSYDLYKIWTSSYQREAFYRPLEDTITTFAIYIFGWNTLPVHIYLLLLHCCLVTFSYYVLVKLKYSHLAALFGALFMLVAQVQVFTVGSNDTLGTMLSSLLCLLSLWFFYRAFFENKESVNYKLYAWSIVLFTISLLCKESSVTFFPFLFVLLLSQESIFSPRIFIHIKKSIICSLPFIVIFVIYYIFHSAMVHVQPTMGEDKYSFSIGLNIPKNIAMMLFSVFLPVSSVNTFEAVQFHDYKFLAIAAGLTAVFAGIIIFGLWKSKKYKQVLLWFCFVVVGFFPSALMNHVNEQYTYFSMPFIAMLAAIGIGYFADKPKRKSRTIILSLFIIFLFINMYSVIQKTRLMTISGHRAELIFGQLNNYFPLVNPGGAMLFVNPPQMPLRYSVFVLPGFEGMRYADYYIYKLAGRQDFRIEVIEWNDAEKRNQSGSILLKLEGDRVLPIQ